MSDSLRDGTSRVYRAVFRVGFFPVAGLFRLRVFGRDNVPSCGGVVVSANQLSNVDAWLVAWALWPRPVHFMGKAELFRRPFRRLLRALHVFPVARDGIARSALEEAVARVSGGAAVGIFVEGTRRRKGFRKRRHPRPHDGAAWVALRAGVPLVPVAITGTDRLWRLRRWTVKVGEPIVVADLGRVTARQARGVLTGRLSATIAALEESA